MHEFRSWRRRYPARKGPRPVSRGVGPGVAPPSRRARRDYPRRPRPQRRPSRPQREEERPRPGAQPEPPGPEDAELPDPNRATGLHASRPGAGRTRRFPADPGSLAPGQGPGPRERTLVRPLQPQHPEVRPPRLPRLVLQRERHQRHDHGVAARADTGRTPGEPWRRCPRHLRGQRSVPVQQQP